MEVVHVECCMPPMAISLASPAGRVLPISFGACNTLSFTPSFRRVDLVSFDKIERRGVSSSDLLQRRFGELMGGTGLTRHRINRHGTFQIKQSTRSSAPSLVAKSGSTLRECPAIQSRPFGRSHVPQERLARHAIHIPLCVRTRIVPTSCILAAGINHIRPRIARL